MHPIHTKAWIEKPQKRSTYFSIHKTTTLLSFCYKNKLHIFFACVVFSFSSNHLQPWLPLLPFETLRCKHAKMTHYLSNQCFKMFIQGIEWWRSKYYYMNIFKIVSFNMLWWNLKCLKCFHQIFMSKRLLLTL